MATKKTPQQVAMKLKAGRGWLIVRNSATIAETDYEERADEIVAALNESGLRAELAAALRLWEEFWKKMPPGQLGKIVCDIGILNEAFIRTSRVLAKVPA